jgi:hypothetical protein
MKTSLGLYGDSFVGTRNLSSWTNVLHTKYNYDVTNYGFPGSGLDYSYYHFIKTQHNHEQVIFVAANIYRNSVFKYLDTMNSTVEDCIDQLSFDGIYGSYEGYEKMSGILTGQPLDSKIKKYISNKLEEWAAYGFSNELLKYNAMISHIKLLRPDIHFVYAFNVFDPRAFWNISQLDMKKYHTQRESNLRANHMTLIQNLEVAHNMDCWLSGKMDFNDTLLPDCVMNYYSTASSVEESGLIL